MEPIEAVAKYGFPALCVLMLAAVVRAYEMGVKTALDTTERAKFESKVLTMLEQICTALNGGNGRRPK
jgi:hypothetical protein